MAVTVEPPATLLKTKRKLKVDFEFISDEQGALMDLFGLRHVGGQPQENKDIPRPASILIDGQGAVLWSAVADNYRVRPKPKTVLAAARKALAE